MNPLFKVLVFVHVFSAIVGMGPSFVLTTIGKSGKTMTELKHSYAIRYKLHNFVMIGGTLLLITGLLMGSIETSFFHKGWYITSLLLFLFGLALGPIALLQSSKPIKALLNTHEGETIPDEYYRLAKKLFRLEYLGSTIFLIIIVLMILKPY